MAKFTKTGHFISSKIGQAIGDYNLIEEDDRILVAVSGGKDSLTLLKMLREREKWSPVKFEVFAAHVKTDFRCESCVHVGVLEKLFKDMAVKYVFKEISILSQKRRPNCFWCSWNRRKTLFQTAEHLGCNKVALGHHKDDIIETTLLNLFFQGEFSTMNPRQELFKGKIVIIRPLCYVEENMTKRFAAENNFPEQLCRCPYAQDSNRKYVKALIEDIKRRSPHVKTNLFRSLWRIKEEYLDLKKPGGGVWLKLYRKRSA